MAGVNHYVILADLSPSHHTLVDEVSLAHFEAMVAMLAHLHAACWERHDLLAALRRARGQVAGMCPESDTQYADLLMHLGDVLSTRQRQVLQRYLSAAPMCLREHLQAGATLTLCHPDTIATNVLFPRQSGGTVYLIDWHVYRVWWGPIDVAALLTRSRPA